MPAARFAGAVFRTLSLSSFGFASDFGLSCFEFVSDFDIRVSNFSAMLG